MAISPSTEVPHRRRGSSVAIPVPEGCTALNYGIYFYLLPIPDLFNPLVG